MASAPPAARLRAALRCPACGGQLSGEQTPVCTACERGYRIENGVFRLLPPQAADQAATRLYDDTPGEQHGRDATEMPAQFSRPVQELVDSLSPDALLLEIGSGRGAFDRISPGYVALDLSFSALARYSSGQRVQASAEALPFADRSFDAVFTIAALEHVPNPERALAEIDRILAPAGLALIYPAWYVRPWVSTGLAQRRSGELGMGDRARKALIPLRDRREYQLLSRLPRRLATEVLLAFGVDVAFHYRPLQPRLDEYVTSDSDAFSSMDPHAASAYFVARGYRDLRRGGRVRRLGYGYEPVLVRKPGGA